MTQPEEIWKPVVGYEETYEVSSHGRVKRLPGTLRCKHGRILKPRPAGRGYLKVTLYQVPKKQDYYLHEIVGNAFKGPCPNGLERNHKDGRKTNNTPENIEYITHADNQVHASRNGLFRVGSRRSDAKLNEMLVRVIKLNLRFESRNTVALWFGIPQGTIGNIKYDTCWKHVTLEGTMGIPAPLPFTQTGLQSSAPAQPQVSEQDA